MSVFGSCVLDDCSRFERRGDGGRGCGARVLWSRDGGWVGGVVVVVLG